MRTTLALALAGLFLAGCMAPASTSTTGSTGPGGSDAVPAGSKAPAFDVKAFLEDHAAFVRKDNERAANKPTHEAARADLMARFESYGLTTYRQNFTTGGLVQANIIGIKWGAVRDQWVVVGGHYDTITDDCLVGTVPVANQPNPCALRTLSQGAYDDGSGTMLSVHLGKAFANVTTYYTMAFVAYDGEERGTQGAAAFVQEFVRGPAQGENLTQPFGAIKVVTDVDLDMVGINWPGTWNPINVMTNSEALYKETVAKTNAMGFPNGQIVRKNSLQLGSSDYARFWEVTPEDGGPIPTIFLISAFEEVAPSTTVPVDVHTPAPAGVYPFWHLEDTIETMRFMAGDPPADALPHPHTEAGFQAAGDLAAHLLYLAAAHPNPGFDAVVK